LLLSYTQSTLPWPLEVSTAAGSAGKIFFAVAGTPDVLCKTIVISVPVGELDGEVYSATPIPTISINTANWSPSAPQITPGDDLGYKSGVSYAVFTLTNQVAGFVVTDPFKVTISGNVNTVTGEAGVELKELSSPVLQPAYLVRAGSFTFSKAFPVFYARNFIAASPGTPTIPATEFANGAGFMLAWESNGAYFELYQKAISRPIYQGIATTYTITGGIATDSTFILVANWGEETLCESITITVSNPDITPKTIVASGNASVGGTLSVTGNTTLSKATIADTNINGALSVNGTANLQTTNIGTNTVNANLAVNGSITANQLTVSGNTTLKDVTINGSIKMGDWVISLDPGSGPEKGNLCFLNTHTNGYAVILNNGGFECGGGLSVAGTYGYINNHSIVTEP